MMWFPTEGERVRVDLGSVLGWVPGYVTMGIDEDEKAGEMTRFLVELDNPHRFGCGCREELVTLRDLKPFSDDLHVWMGRAGRDGVYRAQAMVTINILPKDFQE